MYENGITSAAAGLLNIIYRINVLTPQAPSLFRDYHHKIGHIRLTFISSMCVQLVLFQLSTNMIPFNRFFVALRESFKLAEKSSFEVAPTHFKQYGSIIPRINYPCLFYWFSQLNRSSPRPPEKVTRPPSTNAANKICSKCVKRGHYLQYFCTTTSYRDVVRKNLSHDTYSVCVIHVLLNNLEHEENVYYDPTLELKDLLAFDRFCVGLIQKKGETNHVNHYPLSIHDDPEHSTQSDITYASNTMAAHFHASAPPALKFHQASFHGLVPEDFRQVRD